MPTTKAPEIRNQYKPSDKEYEDLHYVYNRYQAMKESPDRTEAESNWDKWERQYEGWRTAKPTGSTEWQSNHVVPITSAIVEAALSEMVDQSPRPLILPRGQEDVPRAMVMKHIFEYTWEVSDGDTEEYNVIKDALVFGTGIAQEFYWKDRRMIKNLEVLKKGKVKETEEVEAFDYDDCYMEAVKLQDFYVDEKARGFTGPTGARDCIRRYIMNIEDFRLFFIGDVWDPMGNAKYVTPGGDVNYYEFYSPPQGIDTSQEVEVLWYWSKKPEDKLMIIANDVVIRSGPNIYKHKQLPFARAVDVKRTHRFYGKGEPELLESVQDEMNTIRRMVIDRNHLDIDKMFFVSNRVSLNDEDLIARPHGMIPTDDPDSVKAVDYGDIPRSVELSYEKLGEDALQATGIDYRFLSTPSAGTATEAAIIKESVLKRIRTKLRILEREFLVNIARLRVSNIIQFYRQPKLQRIVGDANSAAFQSQVMQLAKQGSLEVIGNEPFEKKFKEIRLEDKMLDFNEKGSVVERPQPGYSFFEAKPEYFIPVARGGFDIKFAAGSTLPISKPLMQSKTTEMYDRLIQLALAGVGYDPVKLGDQLLKVNDFNPEEFKVEQAPAGDVSEDRLKQLIDLAMQENKMLMQGKQVGPTPYASPAHTQIHAQYMQSEPFQALPTDSPVIQGFLDHVIGELMAQQGREEAGNVGGASSPQGLPPRPAGPEETSPRPRQKLAGDMAGGNKEMTATLPALIQGGGQAPSAI